MPPDLRDQLQLALDDSYAIDRELPRGGMSRVFAATERALRRTVVIKVLSPELAATLSTARFKREIRLAASLQHPHIVPLLSAGEAAGSLYYTMPLVDGESLRDRINRERPMPIESVVSTLADVAGALDYAHAQGIIHRDIKPENWPMLFHDRAVVLDFGIGKALTLASSESGEQAAHITQTGMSLGTPMYIPPEQAAGDPDLDHRADIYALGVVAYEMLCGHPPFSGRTPLLVIQAHANQAPEPISKRRSDTPPALANIVMRCLEKRPADRPGHAGEIVRALRGTPASGMQAMGMGSVFARIPLWVPWAVAATATLVAVLLAARLAIGR